MRAWRLAALVAAVLQWGPAAAWADYPDRPLQMIVPFPAGGTVDVVARRFAESLAETLGQPVAVLNRDGASGVIGTQAVGSAAPDGYTVGFDPNGPLTVQPSLKKVPYSLATFRPICQVFVYPYVLAVKEDSPIASLKDFVTRARNAAAIKYGFGGVGTAPHFAMLQLSQAGGMKPLGVPYRGDPPVAVALKTGEVDAAVLTVEVARAQGFRLLAVFFDKRLVVLPDVPTAREQGFDVVATTNAGLIAPAKIPAKVAQRLESACSATLQGSKFQAGMKQLEQQIAYLPGDKFLDALAADEQAKRRLIESSGIKREE
jgi:tripartite-type tricarboxylate transporter receptor subunit TctC